MKKFITPLLLLIFVFSQISESFAQQKASFEKMKPESCELNNINLENADRQAKKDASLTGKSNVIILIGRAGKKDTKEGLTERRLYTAKAYLTKYLERRGEQDVVTAQALNNGNEYGIIEIYVTGQLYDVIASNPNFDVGFGSCDSPETDDQKSRAKRALLYPWIYKDKRAKTVNSTLDK